MSTKQPKRSAGRVPELEDQPFAPRPQDLVLTLLGAFVRPTRRERIWAGGLVQLMAEFGFSRGAARVALARVAQRDLVARVRDGRLVHYNLTPRADDLLAEGDRRIFSLGRERHEAEHWTVLWQTIPDERRMEHARLTRRLRFLGFGSAQNGTWISPHDREAEVTRLVSSLGISEHVVVLLGQPAASLDFLPFARRAWDLDHLDARYEAFAREFAPFLSVRRRELLTDRETFLLRTRLVHTFRAFPFLDPELPDDYMPEPRHRSGAVEVFDNLYPALAPRAQRHFDAVTRPPTLSGAPRGG
jgi:phenylacetic acid degradation operon negative regulatory protein